jgi:hypothetical protein
MFLRRRIDNWMQTQAVILFAAAALGVPSGALMTFGGEPREWRWLGIYCLALTPWYLWQARQLWIVGCQREAQRKRDADASRAFSDAAPV